MNKNYVEVACPHCILYHKVGIEGYCNGNKDVCELTGKRYYPNECKVYKEITNG